LPRTATPCEARDERAPLLTVALNYPRTDLAVCTAAGEVDLATAPLLREQLQKAISGQPQRLVVDLSAVTFFAAAGVGALHDARAAQASEQDLVLVATARTVLRVLDACQVGYRRYLELDDALAPSGDSP
jgi:anti-sigma B factor antagonist